MFLTVVNNRKILLFFNYSKRPFIFLQYFFSFDKKMYICSPKPVNADVVELVDTLDLGSSAVRRGGSIPFIRTKKYLIFKQNPENHLIFRIFLFLNFI